MKLSDLGRLIKSIKARLPHPLPKAPPLIVEHLLWFSVGGSFRYFFHRVLFGDVPTPGQRVYNSMRVREYLVSKRACVCVSDAKSNEASAKPSSVT
jgi:hypothetical protein